MRIAGRIVSVLVLLGLLASLAVPVKAEGDGLVTFRVHFPQNLSQTPEDAVDTITFEGTWVSGYNVGTAFISFYLEMMCEDVADCDVDIYYKVELEVDWVNSFGGGYPSLITAPTETETVMGNNDPLVSNETPTTMCGGPTGTSGSCDIQEDGIITKDFIDVANPPHTPEQGQTNDFHLKYGLKWYISSWAVPTSTTHYKIIFSTEPITDQEIDCSGQYNVGQALGTFVLYGNDSTGKNLRTVLGLNTPAPGSYYKLTVTGTGWFNNGAGLASKIIAMNSRIPPALGGWEVVGSGTFTECAKDDSYYLQMPSSNYQISFRVADFDSNWANTGSVTVTVYAVTARSRYPSGCELQYNLGALIQQQAVDASLSQGVRVEGKNDKTAAVMGGAGVPVQARYYMFETIGGPANINVVPNPYTYLMDLARSISAEQTVHTFEPLETASFVECVVATDMIGHYRVFFKAEIPTSAVSLPDYYFWARVRDGGGNYSDNNGSVSYRIYEASFLQTVTPGTPPTATGCSAFSHQTLASGGVTIDATSYLGSTLPTLANLSLYALQVEGGPWLDNGVGSYGVQLSDDNGATWADLEDFPNLLCSQAADGQHIMIYVYGASGHIWKARADESTGNWGNNTGTINLAVYPGENKPNYWPQCSDAYTWTKIVKGQEESKIGGENAQGVGVSGIVKNNMYMLEITGDAQWFEGGSSTGSYLVDISDDSGQTWEALETYPSLCAEMVANGRYRIVFTATTSNIGLRVRDADDNFLTNTGYVIYALYSITSVVPPGTPGNPGTPPPEWVVACTEAYMRPDSLVTFYNLGIFESVVLSVPVPRVADWLEYVRSSIVYYFAWCPQHTAALTNMTQVTDKKEPIASILMLIDFWTSIKETIEASNAAAGGAGSGLESQEPELFSDTDTIGAPGGASEPKVPSGSGPWDMFTVWNTDQSNNILFGGQVDFAGAIGSTDLSLEDDYNDACNAKFYALFGVGTTTFCSLMSLARYSKVITYVLAIVDLIATIWFGLKYMPSFVGRWYRLITGNTDRLTNAAYKL